MSLSDFGFDPHFERLFHDHAAPGERPARVVFEARERYRVVTEEAELSAELLGRLRHEAAERAALPAVGDWVALGPDRASPARIARVLPRRTAFTRKSAGRASTAQVVGANVDVVLLVTAPDDFSPARLGRYAALAWSSGAAPAVVLNKSDLAADADALAAEAALAAPGMPVVALSAATGAGLEALHPLLPTRRTVALLGSSGVGKTSIVNALAARDGAALGRATLPTRAHDGRGRHATTARQLLRLPSGVLVLDTPGMREIGLVGDGAVDLHAAYADVASLAAGCRFRDCRHAGEPGCAVREAAAKGLLDEARVADLEKLAREAAYLDLRRREGAARAEKLRWKSLMGSASHRTLGRRS